MLFSTTCRFTPDGRHTLFLRICLLRRAIDTLLHMPYVSATPVSMLLIRFISMPLFFATVASVTITFFTLALGGYVFRFV